MSSTSSVYAPICVERLFMMHSGTSPDTGSIGGLYDLLVQAGIDAPVEGNQEGSYLTMKSNQGMVFGAATILSGFAGVFCDQGTCKIAVIIIGREYQRKHVYRLLATGQSDIEPIFLC